MDNLILEFKPIDLDKHSDICIACREDSFICSFGSTEMFYQADGKGAQRYLEWLRKQTAEIPNSCVHGWKDNRIISQIEMGQMKTDPSVGYVYIFYLIPEFRGSGMSTYLERHAASFFKSLGLKVARLSVSLNNKRAIQFYLKHRWRDIGPREGYSDVHYMEKIYEI